MPKRGQHNKDVRDSDVSRGQNNPDNSVTITTGSYKKPETYEKQAYEGKDPHKQAQNDKKEWINDTREHPSTNAQTRARDSSLSASDERKYAKAKLAAEQRQEEEQRDEEYEQDLRPDFMAGQNHGLAGPQPGKTSPGQTAYDMTEVQRELRHLTDTELKQILIVPVGTRLQQGATYIDLKMPGNHEFKAMGDQEAGPHNWYVAKSDVDYQLWNKLTHVDNPERLGQADDSSVR